MPVLAFPEAGWPVFSSADLTLFRVEVKNLFLFTLSADYFSLDFCQVLIATESRIAGFLKANQHDGG